MSYNSSIDYLDEKRNFDFDYHILLKAKFTIK